MTDSKYPAQVDLTKGKTIHIHDTRGTNMAQAAAMATTLEVMHERASTPVTPLPARTKPPSITLDLKQATELLAVFGGEPTALTVSEGVGHSGPGLYVYFDDMPEEGAYYLGVADDEAKPAEPNQSALMTVLSTLVEDDKWHQDYDDHDGYPGSDLQTKIHRAIEIVRDLIEGREAGISREEFIAQAKQVYMDLGDDGPTATECAKYLWSMQDILSGEIDDPRQAAQDDVRERGRPAAATPATLRAKLLDIIKQHVAGTFHCTRVWEAWHVGTMSQDDFELVEESDTPNELVDAILASLAAQSPAVPSTDYLEGVNIPKLTEALVWLGVATAGQEEMGARLAWYVNEITSAVIRHKELFRAAQSPDSGAGPALPNGWAVVPLEPTDDMLISGMEADCAGRPSVDDDRHVRSIWNAMLATSAQQGAQNG